MGATDFNLPGQTARVSLDPRLKTGVCARISIKEEFLAKSGSKIPALRAFYFNFAAHPFNIWTMANILRAEETGEGLSKGKQLTAGELMQAIEDDPRDLQIPTEPPETRQIFDDVLGAGWSTSDAN
jgi:hypothetical protein